MTSPDQQLIDDLKAADQAASHHVPVRSLASKLAEIMAAVSHVPKDGTNEFQHYQYSSETATVAAVRQELATRHVILLPSIDVQHTEFVGPADKRSIFTTLKMMMTFVDGESGEQFSQPWAGQSLDRGDKGMAKAVTGAVKSFILKSFLLPTGDDPEASPAGDAVPPGDGHAVQGAASPPAVHPTAHQPAHRPAVPAPSAAPTPVVPGTVTIASIDSKPLSSGKPSWIVIDGNGVSYRVWNNYKTQAGNWVEGSGLIALCESAKQAAESVLLKADKDEYKGRTTFVLYDVVRPEIPGIRPLSDDEMALPVEEIPF